MVDGVTVEKREDESNPIGGADNSKLIEGAETNPRRRAMQAAAIMERNRGGSWSGEDEGSEDESAEETCSKQQSVSSRSGIKEESEADNENNEV